MKGFLATKKARDEADVSEPSLKKSRTFLGRKKKNTDAPPALDLAVVLPSSENFRTSLIMPGLSARFSMLKEADDPLSKLGKANDDSVINRRSRHFTSLGGIDEDDSLKSPVRPPFASGRTGSYQSDGYTTDDDSVHSGSIMSRSRPGEGNMLFGGRQKIYRIPIGDAGAVNNLGGGESRGMRGRALYEDDVNLSAFQRFKQQEREAARAAGLDTSTDTEAMMNSPTVSSYDEKRQTTSSTNSGPSMTSSSTAATSINIATPISTVPQSPSVPSPVTATAPIYPSERTLERSKSKRLYEQGLDQHIQDQQSANLTRLNSVSRKPSPITRTPTVSKSSQNIPMSKSASNLRDRFEQADAAGVALDQLPPTEGLTTFESLRKTSAPQFPSARPRQGSNEILSQALDSRDRGKATALGTFNKPKQFDEKQFLERQQSLMRSRSVRSPVQGERGERVVSPSSSRPSADGGSRPSMENRFRRQGRPQSPALETINLPAVREQSFSRLRTPSEGSNASKSSAHAATKARPRATTSSGGGHSYNASVAENESCISSPKLSFERGQLDDAPAPLRQVNPPSLEDHPAMRHEHVPSSPPKIRRQGWAPGHMGPNFSAVPDLSKIAKELQTTAGTLEASVKEPTDSSANLRGLVREHLRHGSDSSSIYPSRESRAHFDDHAEYDVRIPSMYNMQANPWDTDDFAIENYKIALSKGADHRHSPRQHTSIQTIRPPTQDAEHGIDSKLPADGKESVEGAAADWRTQLERQNHLRAGSSETQAERTAFAEELAQRQRAIQENLRVKENFETSRSSSPSAPRLHVFETSFNPLGMLKPKSSRDSLTKTESRTKRNVSSKLADETMSSHSAHEKNLRTTEERAKSPIGRTLHMRMPHSSDESHQQSHDQVRVRQSSVTSTLGREASDSPSITLAESSRTSASREETPSDQSERPLRDARDEAPAQRSHGYFETWRPQSKTANHAEDGLDSGSFPFDKSGAIVEETRLRSNSAQHGSSASSPTPSGVPPLVTSGFKENRLNGATSPMSDVQLPTPYSANSTPPLSSISSPSLRNDANDISLASQLMDYRSRGQEMEVAIHPSQFHFPARDGGHKKSHRKRGPTITKADISEPRFVSATSTMDTVPLPAGASLSNGITSDIDVVLQASNRTAAQHNAAIAAAMSPFQRQDSEMGMSENRSMSPDVGMAMSSISVTRMPPPPAPLPVGGNAFRKGFLKFGGHRNKPDEEDDYVSRPSGGRLRIRKISNEDEGPGKPRHRVVGAAEMEQNGFI